MTCAGYTPSNVMSTWLDDAGSAMFCYYNRFFQVDGISMRHLTFDWSTAFLPSLFSRVCQVLDWIESTLD